MESKTDQLVDAIAKLIKLTQDGEVLWLPQPIDEALKQYPDDEIGPVFTATYGGRNLRIYRRRYKYEPGQFVSGVTNVLASSLGMRGRTPGTWRTEVILEIIDEQGVAIWPFPIDPMLRDLFSAVRYQAAGVKEFLADVLREE